MKVSEIEYIYTEEDLENISDAYNENYAKYEKNVTYLEQAIQNSEKQGVYKYI